MGTTLVYGISYPSGTAAPNVPVAVQATAQSVEAALAAQDVKITKNALGVLATKTTATASTGLGATSVLCDYVGINLVANRYYTATYRVNTVCTGAANLPVAIQFRKSAQSDVTATGTDMGEAVTTYTAPVAGSGASGYATTTWKAGATESVNLKATMARAGGTATFDISLRQLVVTDGGS